MLIIRPLHLLASTLLIPLTLQYLVKCNDAGDRRPNVSINPRVYPSLESICEYGAGCTCDTQGSFTCSSNPGYSVHIIFTAFQEYCTDHCKCIALASDLNPQNPTQAQPRPLKYWKPTNENSNPNKPAPAHICSGTCSEVARACSWAYTGECMCTAASTPDPWGLFASHGCVAVLASSRLGGRDLAQGNLSHPDASAETNSSSVAGATERANSIVKGANGYYNASTGVQVACPCNSTCVSYGCCGSNGMTFEPADTCLGKLDLVDSDERP